jgi:branched-chain amino acid transport system ATP-binding protein
MLLDVRGVSRVFGGIRAVDNVDLNVASGEIVGLIGPNGAGKTTLINLISGLLRPRTGSMLLHGQRLERLPPYRIAALGVARTYQNVRLFRGLSALENVVVGQHVRRREALPLRLLGMPAARREAARARDTARALLHDVGLAQHESTPAGVLPYGHQRRLEIARALASSPRLLLLDEPAAGMPFSETARLMELIRGLPARGLSVLLVEHNMQLVMSVCDRVAVLDFGRKIADAEPAMVRADARVVQAYLGADEDA